MRFGKGWYLIEQSLGLACPACTTQRRVGGRRDE
jgi:hypothetical protein